MDNAIALPLGQDDPRKIGRFTIIGLLGAGGMGEVYLGMSEKGYVAVKRIRPLLVPDERFKREVGILYQVPAGVAPGVLAQDSTVARPWFASEYVPGVTVEEALELRRPLPPDALWLLLAEIAAHLRAVHAIGITHRDLKPANVMLVHDGVKLIDFGIARAVTQARLTRKGESYGTPGFTAPEQQAGDLDAASPADVYSLGALLVYAASQDAPGRVLDIGPLRRADPDLAALAASCLADDPALRPTAAGLVEAARSHVVAADPIWPPEVMDRIEKRRTFAAVPLGKRTTEPPFSPKKMIGCPPLPTEDPRTTIGPSPEQPEFPAKDPRRGPGWTAEPWLHPAAEKLAADVRRQWEREERLRKVHDPYPLPVRFAEARAGLFDHWANIRKAERQADSRPLPLSGDLGTIADVYRSVPSGRMAMLGEAGSGKTILALRFVLDWLKDYQAGDRVPVIFSLGSWDPSALSLRDWMSRQLVRDHNTLGETRADGRNLAESLLDNHRILPVLDGFDEIAPGLQGAALEALNYYAEPLLLTSRPSEYARAVRAKKVLRFAACVELRPLGFNEIDDYLTRASPPLPEAALRTVWEPVLSELREQEPARGTAIAEAFTTPLMVTLARTVYSDDPGQDPRELLDSARFGTAEAVRRHLLARFVPAAYRQRGPAPESPSGQTRRWDSGHAQHWLGYVAWHLEEQGERDLAWWELGTVRKRHSLVLVVMAVVGVAAGVVAGFVYGTAAALQSGPASGLWAAVVAVVMNGLGVGLTFGLMHGFLTTMKVGGPVFEPSYMRIQLRGGMAGKLRRSFLPRVAAGTAGGLLFGLLWATGTALYSAAFGVNSGPSIPEDVALGTGLGAAIGIVAALGSGLENVSEQENAAHPAVLLRKNRANALIQLLIVGLVIGVGYAFVLGPPPGIAAGLLVPIGLSSMTPWGRWVVLVRVWLPLTGQAPWMMVAFLEDAHRRGVLRQAGAVYQFRHVRVQAQLAERFETKQTVPGMEGEA